MSATRVLRALARAPMPTASTSRLAHTAVDATGTHALAEDTNGDRGVHTPTVIDFEPYQPVPQTHGNHVMTLQIRSYEHSVMDFYIKFIQRAAANLKIPTSGVTMLPTSKELHTVPRSHFVNKKTQENYARYTHRRSIKVYDTSPEVLDLWLRYIKQHSMAGMGFKAYMNEMVEFGFASGEVSEIEKAMNRSKIEKVARKYIAALSGEVFEPEQHVPKPESTPQVEAEVTLAKAVDDAPKTGSEEAVKGETTGQTPEELQGETAGKAKKEADKEAETEAAHEEAVANAPKTDSEAHVKSDTHKKSPKQLQDETASKAKQEAVKEEEHEEALSRSPKTDSEHSVKGDASDKKPHQLQRETASKAKKEADKEAEAEAAHEEAVANAPKTDSEAHVKGDNHKKSPKQLQDETASKAKKEASKNPKA